jgi:acyl-CoA oxidase
MTGEQARNELDRIVHGTHDAQLRDRLLAALALDSIAAPDMASKTHRMAQRLGRLAGAMPPITDLFRRPEQLTAMHAWAAVSEPSLCMTTLTHYMLCLNSVVSLSGDPAELRSEGARSGGGPGQGLLHDHRDRCGEQPRRYPTIASYDAAAREFVLSTPDSGAAKFVGAADTGVPQAAVVLARLVVGGADCGVFSFLVDLCDASGARPGIRFSPVLELSALPLDYSLVTFNKVRLAFPRWLRDSAFIDEDDTFHDPLGSPDARLQRTLHVGQALWGTVPAAAAATARQSAVLALRHSSHRVAFGRLAPGAPVLVYRPQQQALLGALADAFTVTCAANRARGTVGAGRCRRARSCRCGRWQGTPVTVDGGEPAARGAQGILGQRGRPAHRRVPAAQRRQRLSGCQPARRISRFQHGVCHRRRKQHPHHD